MTPDTPLVLLHAFPLNAAMWKPQLGALTTTRVLCPDFPGFGTNPPGTNNIDGFARAALSEMDAAGVNRAVVAGLSMGGYVALRLIELAPDRVAGLILADTRAGADDQAGRTRRTAQAQRVRADGVTWMANEMIPALLGDTTRQEKPAVEETVRTVINTANPEGVARALEAMRDRPDSTDRLPGIQAPTLVIVGEEDTLTPPSEAQIIADRVPTSNLAVIPNAGHLSNLENPEAFNQALIDFLRGSLSGPRMRGRC